MLKLHQETPHNAYSIMTLWDIQKYTNLTGNKVYMYVCMYTSITITLQLGFHSSSH